MANKKKLPEIPHKPTKAAHLAQYCLNQVNEVLAAYEGAQRIDIAEHLLQMFSDIADYYTTGNGTIYDSYRLRHDALVRKYGKAFKPVESKAFYKLFDFQTVLPETNYYTAEEFNALADTSNQLAPEDIQNWTKALKNYLYHEINAMYLEQEPETPAHEALSGTSDKEMTEARRLLAIYFMVKAGFGIEHHKTNSASDIARLAHLLLGKEFTTLQNSSIYAKYKKMPEYNAGGVLIKDLRYIRPYFEALDMKTVLTLIDEQIEATIKELPFGERKKYS